MIAKQTGTLLRNDIHITTHQFKDTYKLHIFQFHNTEAVPSAMIRFNWFNCYPAVDSIYLDTSVQYVAPIYYSNQGKPYMNPHPSLAQELSHPILPADELMFFGVVSAQKKYLIRFMRFCLKTAEMDVQFMLQSSNNPLFQESADPKPTLPLEHD